MLLDLRVGDCLEVMKSMQDESVDVVVTSPPYFNLRDYGVTEQIGNEVSSEDYLNNLMDIFDEVRRILKPSGSCWVNIDDVYINQSLTCIPDRFKIRMVERGWFCRNEIIWHKPNAMPSSAKTRFNNDFEKVFFFTKNKKYFFETQYEPCKTTAPKSSQRDVESVSKYQDSVQEASVRQGMNKRRGLKEVYLRKNLPTQEEFVEFLRCHTNVDELVEVSKLKRTKIEHWFRRDTTGFSYPSVEDWNLVKHLLDDGSDKYKEIDHKLTDVTIETDDIWKNIHKGRIKRSVWSINTKPFKGYHFASFPEALVEIPIKACCPIDGVVLDPFMGSGTTGVMCKKLNRNFIGIDINPEYVKLANERIDT